MEVLLKSRVMALRVRLGRGIELLRHLKNNPLAFAGMAIVLGIIALAILAPVLAPPNVQDPYQRPRTWQRPEPPGTPGHLLGTGLNGADIYYGIIWGTRVSLRIGGTVVGATVLIGVLLGGLAGFFGRWVDELIMRLTDLFMSIPGLILAMAVASALGRSLENILIALVIVWWPWYVRIFRSQVLVTKQSQYIEAAQASGASRGRIIFKHIVPNSMAPVIVQASLDMGVTLLIAAGLSFIGFGAQPGYAEWGIMISEGKDFMAQGLWWMVFFPGLAISIFVLGFNLLGDGLRDVLDPKLRVLFREPRAVLRKAERVAPAKVLTPVPSGLLGINSLLGVEGLSLHFPTARGDSKVLEEVSFGIERGETFGLVGETGCGKSVTAKTLVGLIDRPPAKITQGRVLYSTIAEDPNRRRKTDLLLLEESQLAAIRGNVISMVFQDPMTSLNPVLKVGDQIAESLLIHQRTRLLEAVEGRISTTLSRLERGEKTRVETSSGVRVCSNCLQRAFGVLDFCPHCDVYFGTRIPTLFRARLKLARRLCHRALHREGRLVRLLSRLPVIGLKDLLAKEAWARAIDLITEVRIPDPENTADSYPFELSGGMQQRVSIAMALACQPTLLIADEPTTALDVTIQAQILKLIGDVKEEIGTSVFLITHNLGVVAEQCDRVAVMYAGSIAELADVETVFREPLHPYTQGLIAAIPVLGQRREDLAVIRGRVPDLVEPPSGCRFRTRCQHAFERCSGEVPRLEEVKPGHWVSCHLYGEEVDHDD